jgi:hypothetical protein
VEKSRINLTPYPPTLVGQGEKLKPLSYEERGMEARFSTAEVKSKLS